jgi:C4-dicarboxylate-specific signal transduction histidine kinase
VSSGAKQAGETGSSANRWVSACLRYGLAFFSVGLALLTTTALRPTIFPTPLFFAAIVISTWYGGTGPGMLSVVLAVVAVDFSFVAPFRTFKASAVDLPYVLQFALPALLTSWIVVKRKEAETALKLGRDHLEDQVQQRTAELRLANQQLQAEFAERRRAEEAFHTTQANLAHLTRLMTMSELTTSIAHEVNQPLAAIVTNGDACRRWLASAPPNVERAQESIAQIIQQGNCAGEVIRRIRELSRKALPKPEPIALPAVVSEVASLLAAELKQNQVTLHVEFAPNLSPVRGDLVQVQQVVMNLVMNAIDALKPAQPPRYIKVAVSAGLAVVEVAVTDSGPGLRPGDEERVFDAFFTTKPDGLGMGLSISRTIIEALGGRLWVDPAGGSGATFRFELPLFQEAAE